MSPEQIRGAAVDARSDLFSLAVVLYEALTSKRPFGGQDLPSVAYSVAHETPAPVSQLVEELPSGLDAFFERALAKEPRDRFSDGTTFRLALKEAGAAVAAAAQAAAGGANAKGAAGARRSRSGRGRANAAGLTLVDRKAAKKAARAARKRARSKEADAGEDTEDAAVEAPPRASLFAHKGLVAVIVFFLMTVVGVPVLFAHRRAHVQP